MIDIEQTFKDMVREQVELVSEFIKLDSLPNPTEAEQNRISEILDMAVKDEMLNEMLAAAIDKINAKNSVPDTKLDKIKAEAMVKAIAATNPAVKSQQALFKKLR